MINSDCNIVLKEIYKHPFGASIDRLALILTMRPQYVVDILQYLISLDIVMLGDNYGTLIVLPKDHSKMEYN